MKQDTDEFRVMYREGPKGTLFHTLLAEGYVNGPMDSSLCVGVESTLYPHWWPQFYMPTFKIIESRCLKKIRIGEELSLVRMKVPWPLATREMLFQYFELEYFEEDIIVVLLKSVSDSQVDNSIPGLSSEDIPKAEGAVRMDLMGGFALQKVNSTQSYFRTMLNLDIKMDFVPPSLINFISRQLIGRGYKLYQKSVLAASNGDDNFRKILEHGPLYIRIRAGLQSNKGIERGNLSTLAKQEVKKSHSVSVDEVANSEQIEESKTKGKAAAMGLHDIATSNGVSASGVESVLSNGVEEYHYETSPVPKQGMSFPAINSIDQPRVEGNMSYIDPETRKALEVLDNVIAFVQRLAPGDAFQNQVMSPIIASEPQFPRLDFKGLSESLPDQFCNDNTAASFLPAWKVAEKVDEIESHNELARNHCKQDANSNFDNKINKVESDVPSSDK
ncbi:hypothetical protein KI387_017272, partial [Taxus chinensis]